MVYILELLLSSSSFLLACSSPTNTTVSLQHISLLKPKPKSTPTQHQLNITPITIIMSNPGNVIGGHKANLSNPSTAPSPARLFPLYLLITALLSSTNPFFSQIRQTLPKNPKNTLAKSLIRSPKVVILILLRAKIPRTLLLVLCLKCMFISFITPIYFLSKLLALQITKSRIFSILRPSVIFNRYD